MAKKNNAKKEALLPNTDLGALENVQAPDVLPENILAENIPIEQLEGDSAVLTENTDSNIDSEAGNEIDDIADNEINNITDNDIVNISESDPQNEALEDNDLFGSDIFEAHDQLENESIPTEQYRPKKIRLLADCRLEVPLAGRLDIYITLSLKEGQEITDPATIAHLINAEIPFIED